VCGQLTGGLAACTNRWCSRADRSFSVVFPLGVHSGALRRAIVRYKYQGERVWAGVFAQMVAAYLARNATWFEEFDLIVGVPSYVGAGARRAWDPVGDILVRLENMPGSDWQIGRRVVVKRHETPAMRGLPWAPRQAIAAGPLRRALSVIDPVAVDGARVLVFDDVMTEGSTVQEVARALRRVGAAECAGLVLTRPPSPGASADIAPRSRPGSGVCSCRD
jgi:predicted amidophosphoribosyltransferase